MSARPFHLGHMALIDFAKANCDQLTILITTLPDEVIPYKYRLKWVLSTYLDDPQVQIVADTLDEPSLEGDALSIWWGFYVSQKFGKFDRVFTSEDYGDVFAKSMGAIHFQFNKSRDIVPVSGTKIRCKPITYWDYLNNFAKDYFVKKIAIVGTESTGKSTMTQQLSAYFSKKYGEIISYYVTEAGDDIVSNTTKTEEQQIKEIAAEHAKRILRQTRKTNRVLFCDTDLLITKSYSKFLFGKIPVFEPWIEQANKMDLYIYLMPEAPYVQNGRRLEKDERDKLHENHITFFKGLNTIFIPYQGSYENRLNHVINIVEEFLANY